MIIGKKSRMDSLLKETFSETNKFCNFPFTSRNMPEGFYEHAWSHPGWWRSADARHTGVTRGLETWRRSTYSDTCLDGSGLHGKTEVEPMFGVQTFTRLLTALLSWLIFWHDRKCITALCADFKQWLRWPVSIHHRRRHCSGGTALLWASVGSAVYVAP